MLKRKQTDGRRIGLKVKVFKINAQKTYVLLNNFTQKQLNREINKKKTWSNYKKNSRARNKTQIGKSTFKTIKFEIKTKNKKIACVYFKIHQNLKIHQQQ